MVQGTLAQLRFPPLRGWPGAAGHSVLGTWRPFPSEISSTWGPGAAGGTPGRVGGATSVLAGTVESLSAEAQTGWLVTGVQTWGWRWRVPSSGGRPGRPVPWRPFYLPGHNVIEPSGYFSPEASELKIPTLGVGGLLLRSSAIPGIGAALPARAEAEPRAAVRSLGPQREL